MKTIQFVSDVHLEFTKRDPLAFVRQLDPTDVDILVLAGDISTSAGLRDALSAFADRYAQVVFVCGNHEYYGSSPAIVGELLTSLKIPNLTWLDNRMAEVDGIRFLGGTLWYPRPDRATLWMGRSGMSDYRVIRDFEPWVYEQNAAFRMLLSVKAGEADVVVTHHLPTFLAIDPRYAGQPLNYFYCDDHTNLVETAQPKAWLFGHTHTRTWGRIGKTILACNPRGYPHETSPGRFVPKCLLGVDPERASWLSEPPGSDSPQFEVAP